MHSIVCGSLAQNTRSRFIRTASPIRAVVVQCAPAIGTVIASCVSCTPFTISGSSHCAWLVLYGGVNRKTFRPLPPRNNSSVCLLRAEHTSFGPQSPWQCTVPSSTRPFSTLWQRWVDGIPLDYHRCYAIETHTHTQTAHSIKLYTRKWPCHSETLAAKRHKCEWREKMLYYL